MSDGTVTGNDGSSGGEHSANEVNRLWLINKQLKLDLQAEQGMLQNFIFFSANTECILCCR